MNSQKRYAVIEARRIPKPHYEVKRVWRYGSRRYVVALPDSWRGIRYVLVREDDEGLLIFPLAGIENDAQAAELASQLNQQLEGEGDE